MTTPTRMHTETVPQPEIPISAPPEPEIPTLPIPEEMPIK